MGASSIQHQPLDYPLLLVRQTALEARDGSVFALASVEDGLRESRLSLEVLEEEGGGKKGG
ncbi:hypothetical protein PLEOSDRAFT_1072678 [Pleurotus ostreatus PC15]|uniref:Uncharacterized protein n=1 Tax=Pleurotus ostreatus (strain PC15) TaxID=1137138 RepID=A0A067NHK9_PLEO1|nr:hypothetical protein PLEOSDRAFT_1072678 [Pleurotus ostreatus PC15]